MRSWKKMVVGGAAMLISAGAAHAGQEPTASGYADMAKSSAQQETGGTPSDRARPTADVAVNGDGASYVTHDELAKISRELVERVERERNAQRAAPTFTDAG